MKNPFRTEADAFSFVIVMGLLFGAVALAGVVGGRWVALGVFLALGLGIALGIYMKTEPKVREPAVWDRHRSLPGIGRRFSWWRTRPSPVAHFVLRSFTGRRGRRRRPRRLSGAELASSVLDFG